MLWGNLSSSTPQVTVPALAPDEEGVVLVELVAPRHQSGTYQNHWSLQYCGRCFGHRVWCSIVVDQKEVLESKGDKLQIVDRTAVAEEDQVMNCA